MKRGRWQVWNFCRYPFEELPLCGGCYAIYLGGVLSYIGSSVCLRNRVAHYGIELSIDGQEKITPWGRFDDVTVKYRPTRKYGDWAMVELRLIRRLKPPLNKLGTSDWVKQLSSGQ